MAGWRLRRDHGRQLTLRQLEMSAASPCAYGGCALLSGTVPLSSKSYFGSAPGRYSAGCGLSNATSARRSPLGAITVPLRQPRIMVPAAPGCPAEEAVHVAGKGRRDAVPPGMAVSCAPRAPLGVSHAVDPAVVECLSELRQGLRF